METDKQAEALAAEVMQGARDQIVARMPYLNRALFAMPVRFYAPDHETDEITLGYGCDGTYLYVMPQAVLRDADRNPMLVVRAYLHMVLHCLFFHGFQYVTLDRDAWDFAADAAVEAAVLNLGWKEIEVPEDAERFAQLTAVNDACKGVTAEKIYSWLIHHPDEKWKLMRHEPLFRRDVHEFWLTRDVEGRKYAGRDKAYPAKAQVSDRWKKLERATENQIQSFEKTQGYQPGTVSSKLKLNRRGSYDYSTFLRKFAVSGEQVSLSPDEFDYIYYTYGMSLYGNMPLIEPLEYREDTRIRDFVIAIDTSGSVQGVLVKAFLKKTWEILSSSKNFFEQVNVHVIQCDAKIQKEVTLHNQSEFQEYLKNIELQGFGGTDFRPVFARVRQLMDAHAFRNLRGLLYFTDGKGIFPEEVPPYQTAFIFVGNGFAAPSVPPWVIRLVLPETEFEA